MVSLCIDACMSRRHHNAMPHPSQTCRHVNAKRADQWDCPEYSFFFYAISDLRHSLEKGGGVFKAPPTPPHDPSPSPLVPSSSSQHCPLVSGWNDQHLFPAPPLRLCSPCFFFFLGWSVSELLDLSLPVSFAVVCLLTTFLSSFSSSFHSSFLSFSRHLLVLSLDFSLFLSPFSHFLTVSTPLSLSTIPSPLLVTSPLFSKVSGRSEFGGSSPSLPLSQ